MRKKCDIHDDIDLLKLLVNDTKNVSELYLPGKYFRTKCKSAE